MTNYKKEYWNELKTKGVIINRTKLSDGYNYYLTLINGSNTSFINESYKQIESILSEKKAIQQAKKLINQL